MAGRNSSARSIVSRELRMPDFKEEIRNRVAALQLPPAREVEIVEELSQHLDDHYEQSLNRGATEEEACEAVLAGLAESDLLARELKRIERHVQHEPLTLGNEKTNFLG